MFVFSILDLVALIVGHLVRTLVPVDEPVHRHLRDAVEMQEGRSDDEHVEDLEKKSRLYSSLKIG